MNEQQPMTGCLTVLVVEDEFLIAMELMALLEDAGHHVIGPATSIKAAIAALDRALPDACTLDVNLRGEHSVPVATALNELGVPFVLSSAYDRTTLDQYPAFHDVANFGKPVPKQKLLAWLATAISD